MLISHNLCSLNQSSFFFLLLQTNWKQTTLIPFSAAQPNKSPMQHPEYDWWIYYLPNNKYFRLNKYLTALMIHKTNNLSITFTPTTVIKTYSDLYLHNRNMPRCTSTQVFLGKKTISTKQSTHSTKKGKFIFNIFF